MIVLELAPDRTAPPATVAAALRSGRLRALLGAHLAGKLAQHVLVLAVGMHVLAQTGSGGWASMVVALGFAPQALLSGAAGVLADRYPRSVVLAWSSSIRGCCGVVLLVAALQQWPLPVLVGAVAVAAVAATPAYPAVAAAAPQCVPDPAWPAANTLVSGVENAGWTAGPGLLGVVVLAGGGPPAALAVATLLLAAGTVAACGVALPAPPRGPREPGDLLVVARLVLHAPPLRGPLALATIGNFLYGYLVVALVLLGTAPGSAPEAVGRLNTALAVGAVASLLVVHRLAGRPRPVPVLRTAMLVFGACVLLLGLVRTPIPMVLLVGAAGAGTLIAEIVAVTMLQRAAPPAAHARIFGIYDQLAGLAIALGSLVAGPLAGWLGPETATVLTAAAALVLVVAAGRRLSGGGVAEEVGDQWGQLVGPGEQAEVPVGVDVQPGVR